MTDIANHTTSDNTSNDNALNDNGTISPRSVNIKVAPKASQSATNSAKPRVINQHLAPHSTISSKPVTSANTSVQRHTDSLQIHAQAVRQEHLCLTTTPNAASNSPAQTKVITKSQSTIQPPVSDKHTVQHLFILLLLVIACYLSYTGMLNHFLNLVIHQPIENINNRYLNSAFENAEQTLLVLSAIKGTLAVVQSSSGGISFFIDVNVQLGEILSVISNQIDNAWQVSMVTLTSIEAIRFLLNISKTSMTPLLTILLIAISLMYLLQTHAPNVAERMKRLGQISLFFVILTHLIIPFSILVNTNVSHHIFTSTKSEVHQGFNQINQLMPAYNENDKMHQQVKGSINQLQQHHQLSKQHASHVNHLTTKHKVHSYGEFIIVPTVMIISLSVLTILMIRRKSALDHPEHSAPQETTSHQKE